MVKIIWEVMGYYERVLEDSTAIAQTSVSDLLTDLRTIATYHKQHHLPQVHQSFGLGFLPINTIPDLIQQTSGCSPILTDQVLRPVVRDPNQLKPQRFRYQFVTTGLDKNFKIQIKPEDDQIPRNFVYHRCDGSYEIELSKIKNPIIETIKNEAIDHLRQLIKNQPIEVINFALTSKTPDIFTISLPNDCTAWIKTNKLNKSFQQAIEILRNQTENDASSETIERLINAYRAKYPKPIVISDRIPDLQVTNTAPKKDILVTKGTHRNISHRNIIESLINNAQKFLLICSYRLEDQGIIEMISERSKTIPIWILTDFNRDVQDRVDQNMEGQIKVNSEYINSDQKKQKCLRILSRANIGFRSGKFHIKTYISDKSAYLGSCNLTGGSLGRNSEAGMIWQNTQEHQDLIHYFRYLWQFQTSSQSIPSPTGFRTESLERVNQSFPNSNYFLNYHEFKKDLSTSLSRYRNECVRIYTRNFWPLPTDIHLLNNSRNCIFYGAYNHSKIQATQINNLHAKIIIIGSQVAYIGSQDCAFSYNPLLELTYKTTNPEEVKQITQEAKHLH